MKNIALPVQTSNFTKQAFMTDVFGCNLFTEDLWMVDDCFSTHSAYFPTFGVRISRPTHIVLFEHKLLFDNLSFVESSLNLVYPVHFRKFY